ncbi:MAG: hypothetical protein ACE5HT_04930 [Gemmatimonadales bacterium]
MHKHTWVAAVLISVYACGSGAPFGMVEFGALDLEGTVDTDYLARQLAPLDPRFEACYVRALRKNRATEGTIQIKLRGSGGKLMAEITTNDTGSDDLSLCVTENISALSIVEPSATEPWKFTGDWSIKFQIARMPSRDSTQ